MSVDVNIVAVSVGNSRIQIGLFSENKLVESARVDQSDHAGAVQRVVDGWKQIQHAPGAAVIMASVNDATAKQLTSMIEDQLSLEVYQIGEDIPPPVGLQLDPETITGVDRLLNAAAAYDTLQQACVVVDMGTAITVDFVDGEGTFHGGAIAPGVQMQLDALHRATSALPELEFRAPDDEQFGRSTAQAMLQGVFFGARGLVWKLIERYAEAYGAYPTVIATGGDAESIFKDDEIVDRIVPDLTLLGMAAAARHALAANPEDEDG